MHLGTSLLTWELQQQSPCLLLCVRQRREVPRAPQARRDLTRTMLDSREKKTTLHGNFNDLMDSKLSDYSVIYYEGEIVSAGYNKQGDFYFLLNERDGRGYTSINPSVGKLYFISSSKDVPSEKSWTEEFKARLNDIVNTEVN